jgi:hypothetical protein
MLTKEQMFITPKDFPSMGGHIRNLAKSYKDYVQKTKKTSLLDLSNAYGCLADILVKYNYIIRANQQITDPEVSFTTKLLFYLTIIQIQDLFIHVLSPGAQRYQGYSVVSSVCMMSVCDVRDIRKFNIVAFICRMQII